MAALSNAISSCGGLQSVINKNKWPKVAEILRIPKPVCLSLLFPSFTCDTTVFFFAGTGGARSLV